MIFLLKKLLLLLLIAPLSVFAQKIKLNTLNSEQQKISNFFSANIQWKTIPDSSAVYTFAFKIFVKKDSKGAAHVTSITANDSIAYHIFPNYNFLKTINYALFMKARNESTFIIPVALEVYNSKGQPLTTNTSVLDQVMPLFHYRKNEVHKIDNYIYFMPILKRINKQVFE